MTIDTPDIPDTPVIPDNENHLATYARQAYLEYALSVVKGRALPDVTDGQKPVQRRILYAMQRMGLSFASGSGVNSGPKPVKSARVVGDVLGRFHPHGDQAAYDALVRMAQGFHQRYPLIDGQGNFGSRDGDSAAAMRYTEARLTPIARLLLDEIDQGTIDFVPNYDGSAEEPSRLPARLPFVLLNGASGIAVGLATEIPSHNLGEIAAACAALIHNPALDDAALATLVPGPDFAGGAHIISSAADIEAAYAQGRGSLKVRARWIFEDLARGQWQWVVQELPPGVSCQKILEEVEALTNPQLRPGKKALTSEQQQLKATVLGILDAVRDESNKEAAIRLVFEPKTSKIAQQELIQILLAHTSLEISVSINMTVIDAEGIPRQASLRRILNEWIAFRSLTLQRRSQHRLSQVQDRMHVLEGRLLILLHLDEVIAIIRASDEPKPALMQRWPLSERQTDDILEIRLRQLARLESLRIEQELANLKEEQVKLQDILSRPATLKRLLLKEIEQDAKPYIDARRTLIQEEKKTQIEIKIIDEPVTVVVSQKGWVRVLKGHELDLQSLNFKTGDALYAGFECRTIDHLLAFGNKGRVYSIAIHLLPGGRGEGQPITSFIDLEPSTHLAHYFVGAAASSVFISTNDGYGFLALVSDMVSRQKAGKSFVNMAHDKVGLLRPRPLNQAVALACLSKEQRLLSFDLKELKRLPSGGRGLILMDITLPDELLDACPYKKSLRLQGLSRRAAKAREEVMEPSKLKSCHGARARKGQRLELTFDPQTLEAL